MRGLQLRMTQAQVLRQALLWHRGHFVPVEALEDVLWGGREDGGPLDARGIISVLVCHLRKEGEPIDNWSGFGFKLRSET